jgi:DivIVA domain-containing protein
MGENMTNKTNLTAVAIYEKQFNVDLKGYNLDEVDQFLDQVIEDYQYYETLSAQFVEKNQQLEADSAILKARIIELEGRLMAFENDNTTTFNQLEVLKRLARLEQKIFNKE